MDDVQTKDAQAREMVKLTGVTPDVMVSDANKASEFYQRAFGAREVMRHATEDGKKLMHCHLVINNGSLFIYDPMPEYGHPLTAPQGYTLHLHVDDVDFWWGRALAAGCEVAMPLELQFWGDRYGQVTDPFGVRWSMGQSQ